MTRLDDARWLAETDAFVRSFAERAVHWDAYPGDLEDGPVAPWTDPDHPDERLDAAPQLGIVPQAQPHDGWDYITILRAHGRRLAKRISLDGAIESYDSAKRFDMTAIPVDGIDHLGEDLRWLLHQSDRCVVRGEIADLGRATGARRLLHPDDSDPASLIEVPRRWLALDIDNLARPANFAAEDIAGCAEIATAALPAEFHGARCIAQPTASHGVKPGIRLRLWHWLDRPVCGAELKRWLALAPVDHALFSAAQITYTAAPIFDGRRDPLPARMIRLPGTAQVRVPAIPEPKRRADATPVKPENGLTRYTEVALDSACQRIITAPAGEQEKTMNREAFALGTLAAAGAIPGAFARKALIHACLKIPSYDAARPWLPREIEAKVNHAFDAGTRHPREARHG